MLRWALLAAIGVRFKMKIVVLVVVCILCLALSRLVSVAFDRAPAGGVYRLVEIYCMFALYFVAGYCFVIAVNETVNRLSGNHYKRPGLGLKDRSRPR